MQDVLIINHSVVLDEGEDCFALRSDEQSAFLCVADGCGGLGSKRYENLNGQTGAYIASRNAVKAFEAWADERHPSPVSEEEALTLCREVEGALFHRLKMFAETNCPQGKGRIVGSMQRTLPTTLCAYTSYAGVNGFWWAGDSRGYVMDADGLHQYTRDHVRGETDPFETLYRDAPLSNLLSADKIGRIQWRRVDAMKPGVVMVATDGVYSSLPTPMEVEMLILDTLKAARSYSEWEKKLRVQIARNAQDDATLLIRPTGVSDFEQLKEALLPRREIIQKQFITPVRRHKGQVDYARAKWKLYQSGYDRSEG
ncbi:MAG: protein phosphatase 2C domain-containing protein [Clostridia bacterium]|nr:protein phosphatase 2C domain-containing protein [Clostridia bacterium]